MSKGRWLCEHVGTLHSPVRRYTAAADVHKRSTDALRCSLEVSPLQEPPLLTMHAPPAPSHSPLQLSRSLCSRMLAPPQGGAGSLRFLGGLPARGFVNGLAVAKSGKFLVAAMGQEPRMGRCVWVGRGEGGACRGRAHARLHVCVCLHVCACVYTCPKGE